jgi:hypothetical protein
MGFLDFIKNRQQQASPEQTPNQRPDAAKEMQTRPEQKSVAQIPEAEKSKAKELGARIDRAGQDVGSNASEPSPAGGASSPEPMRQNMTGQDSAAPALSPTSGQLGKTVNEQDKPAPADNAPAKTQERTVEKERQTIARRPPSWER